MSRLPAKSGRPIAIDLVVAGNLLLRPICCSATNDPHDCAHKKPGSNVSIAVSIVLSSPTRQELIAMISDRLMPAVVDLCRGVCHSSTPATHDAELLDRFLTHRD